MSEVKIINLAQRKAERLAGLPAPEIKVDIPDFIEPHDISAMSDTVLEQIVDLIRLRRLTAAMIYEQTVAENKKRQDDKIKAGIEKKAEQVFKLLEKCYDNIDKLEIRVNELRALRLQIGMDF